MRIHGTGRIHGIVTGPHRGDVLLNAPSTIALLRQLELHLGKIANRSLIDIGESARSELGICIVCKKNRVDGSCYTFGMTHKVGVKGQVVIPKAIRDKIGIRPGDEVTFEPDGKDVKVRRVADDPGERARKIKALRGTWADAPRGGTAALEAERRHERELEERKAARWSVGRP